MKHEEIKGKIVAFIDGETTEEQKNEITDHISSCKSCGDEYQALMGMDSYMKNAGDINIPAFFREGLMRKLNAGAEKRREAWILKLVPASAVLAIFVLFASAFLIVSPYLYASDAAAARELVKETIKSAVVSCMTVSAFSPATYAVFCDKCSASMCGQCMAKDPGHKCQCGGNKHGK